MRATQTEQQVHRVVATYIQVIITVLLLINMKYAHDLHALNAHKHPYDGRADCFAEGARDLHLDSSQKLTKEAAEKHFSEVHIKNV